MATKKDQLQKFMRHYRDRTGETDLDMKKVAALAEREGWKMPRPKTPLELLAKEFADAARVETKKDSVTGRPYRVNHAYPVRHGQLTLWLWVDIDQPTTTRNKMLKCLISYREQMIGEAVQIDNDTEHWNRTHPDQEPIQIPLDFAPDVEWRKGGESAAEEEAV